MFNKNINILVVVLFCFLAKSNLAVAGGCSEDCSAALGNRKTNVFSAVTTCVLAGIWSFSVYNNINKKDQEAQRLVVQKNSNKDCEATRVDLKKYGITATASGAFFTPFFGLIAAYAAVDSNPILAVPLALLSLSSLATFGVGCDAWSTSVRKSGLCLRANTTI